MDPNEKSDDKSEEQKEEDDYQEWCEDQRIHGHRALRHVSHRPGILHRTMATRPPDEPCRCGKMMLQPWWHGVTDAGNEGTDYVKHTRESCLTKTERDRVVVTIRTPTLRAKCQKEKVMKRCERAIITKCPNVALSDEPGATCTAHASQEPDVKTEARSLLEWLSGWGDGPNWSDTSGATVPIVKESLRRVLTYVMSEGIPGCAHCDGSGRCTHCDIVSRAT